MGNERVEGYAEGFKVGWDKAMINVREILDEQKNPYPSDIFLWDNEETLNFNRGRFNQHCFEIWVNCKNKISTEITASAGSEGDKSGR